MGTAGYNRQNDWDKADSNCLIAKAAAELNADRNQKLFTVSQGVFQQSDADLQRIEIDRAFKAAEYSNNKYRGTVESIVFTNEYFTDDSKGWQVLNMIQSNKDRARRLGLAVGTRTHVCGHILDPKSASYASLEAIVKNSDIIMCNIYPASDVVHSGIDRAISAVTNFYWALRDRFTKINPQIKVAIGESGWASQGNMFNGAPTSVANLVNYWNQLGDWASRNNILLYLFEAIDEPWKGDSNSAESHFGWWYREGDNFKAKS
ncbi:hypothetical protein B4U79_17493 [Dinothrombium tinctorium]|nr:hypothetical protein B4U79_16696 [Dinothrombium tinctorium]RWS02982.1 hypothetical protein B4U79_16558 [Dinothrombium tinctorium]RWS11967.1 hypothetical protein B4U79_17493 [Dinothrombium tinctorium]